MTAANNRSNSRTLAMLVGVIVFMGAAAWAAVPFYDWFCRVTGYGGTTQRAEAVIHTPFSCKPSKRETLLGWLARPER